MITFLHILGLRHLRMHGLRSLLAAGGIATGVGGLIGAQLIHNAFVEAYGRTVRTLADGADIKIHNGDAGVPEQLVEEVQTISGVARAAAIIDGLLVLEDRHQEKLRLRGVDVLASPTTGRREIDPTRVTAADPIEFISDPESVAVTATTARHHGWTVGSPLVVRAPSGAKRLTVRAVFEASEKMPRLAGEHLLVMDILAAQQLMGMEGRVTQVDVDLLPDVHVAAVEAKVAAAVGGRAQVTQSATSGKAVERLLGSYRHGLTVGAGLCLITALYVVVNVMVVSVVQRRRTIGVLRVVGMTRRQTWALVMVETLALAVVGSVAGILLAPWLAQLSAAAAVRTVSSVYLTVAEPVVELRPTTVAYGFVAALLVAATAVVAAARQVLRRQVLELVRGEPPDAQQRPRSHPAEFVGAGLLAVTSVTYIVGRSMFGETHEMGVAVFLGVLVGVALIVSAGVRLFARRADQFLEHSLGSAGLLAGRVIANEPGSVVLACSALLASLAGALAFAGLVASLESSLAAGLRTALTNVDLIVAAGGEPLSGDGAPMTETLVHEIGALPAVSYVDPIRVIKIPYAGSLAAVVAVDGRLFERGQRAIELTADDRSQAVTAFARGDGVFVTQTFANRFAYRIGDTISLPSPSGFVERPIVGIYLFEAAVGDIGAIKIDRRLYRRYWIDRTASVINVTLAEGADATRASRAITRLTAARSDLLVVTARQLRDHYHAVLTRLSGLLRPMIAVACFIGSLGLLAGRLTSVAGRRCLFLTLRVIGTTRRQRAAVFMTESAVIAMITAVLASLAGLLLGYVEVKMILRSVCGITIPYTSPTAVMLSVVAAAPAIAGASGYWQERLVTRSGCADALHYA